VKAACLALAAAVAAAAAACGGSGGGDPLTAAQSNMEARATARATIDADLHCDVGLDFERGRAEMTCDPPADSDEPRTPDMRVIGETTYLRIGPRQWTAASSDNAAPLGDIDPRTLLTELQKRADEVGVVGKEDVRGVETTRYHMTSEEYSDEPVDIWVDRDGLVRRVRSPGISIEFFDFGAELGIEPPPADEVQVRSVQRLTTFVRPATG
jgi:hypothetical protein